MVEVSLTDRPFGFERVNFERIAGQRFIAMGFATAPAKP